MKNDAQDFAQRLYSRVPAHYRVYDTQQGLPLLALLTVVGEQASNLRQDLDTLWDNFFIETCEDWVVPYIGALIGANLLANPVTRSNRLQVRDTIAWRRSKGTPAMLQALAAEVSGWSVDFVESFATLGWSQNLNHVSLGRVLTPDLRDEYALSLLGRAADPFAHAADLRPVAALEQARTVAGSPGLGRRAWETPGRHQIKALEFFVRRLQMFPVSGVQAAAAEPGQPAPADAACFTFDPLHRDVPLFSAGSGDLITRTAFRNAPASFFGPGKDIDVRLHGISVATPATLVTSASPSRNAFEFGGAGGPLSLDPVTGMRLLNPRESASGGAHFLITAVWSSDGSSTGTVLGAVSTLHARLNDGDAFHAQGSVAGSGQLVINVQAGESAFGWTLPQASAVRFTGAVIAVRAARAGAPQLGDGLYVYLPPAYIDPATPVSFFVSDDGSTYTGATLDPSNLARASEGQAYPASAGMASTMPLSSFPMSRRPGALAFADPGRLGGLSLLVQAELFTGAYQPQAAITTIDQPASMYPALQIPGMTWTAFTAVPSSAAYTGGLPDSGLLALLLAPLTGSFFPACELIVSNRSGDSVLVYLPEIANVPAGGQRVFVAEDGSTYLTSTAVQTIPESFDAFTLARAGMGQVLPIPGAWPLQFRRAVGLALSDPERSQLLLPGEFGVDPELGRFALAPLDPAIGETTYRVDYVESFSSNVGALNYDRMLDASAIPTRLVSAIGDVPDTSFDNLAKAPVYTTIEDALAAAVDGDIIEIRDSTTYVSSAPILLLNAAVRGLTLRAASGQRPCLTFFSPSGEPLPASLEVQSAMDSLELNGLLIAGGPITIEAKVTALLLAACTIDPRFGPSLVASDADLNDRASYLLCRCIAGGLQLAEGVGQLTVADSVLDGYAAGQPYTPAIMGFSDVASPPQRISSPSVSSPPPVPSASGAQLERVTVLGPIYADVLSVSDSILADFALAADLQSGCIRYTRFEPGSALPRRFQCLPTDAQLAACASPSGCLAPIFNSRRFGRPDYLQLASACPAAFFSASDASSEIGAFAGQLNPVRLQNLQQSLNEFMPVGLTPLIFAES